MKVALTKRNVVGKKVNTLRKQGLVPVVCYGNKQKAASYSVDAKILKGLLASDGVVFETEGDLAGEQVILQDIDYHPVSGDPIHVDFLFVDATQEVEHEASIQVEGEAPAQKDHNGQVLITLDKIQIRALPQYIPGHVVADISGLEEIGSRLTASDIPLPDNVTLVTNPDEIVISIMEETQEEEEETPADEDYLSTIEATGKGGKKEERPETNQVPMATVVEKGSLQKGSVVYAGLATALLVCFVVWPPVSFAASDEECFIDLDTSSRETLEKALEKCEQQIEMNEQILSQQSSQRKNTESDILLITTEINKALVRIRQSDVAINNLGEEIVSKETALENLKTQKQESLKSLQTLLQRINETEQKGFVSFFFSGLTLSDFFSRANEYEELRERAEKSIRNVNALTNRIIASVDELEGEKVTHSQLRQQQQATATQVQYQKNEKERLLEHQVTLEKQTEEKISVYASRAAEINNRLFDLRGSGSIPFEEALRYARDAQRATGVRPAFLLGLIKNESDLGRNVGTGDYLSDMHPTRDQPIFPYIAKLLGENNPKSLPVSANPGFGWGGAMGPAQFIPSTWVCYGGLINTNTGTCSITGAYIQSKTLEIGSSGSDVKRLQKFLNQHGFTVAGSGSGSPGQETNKYGNAAAAAVKKFQERYASRILRPYGLTRGTGSVGPSTRAAINQLYFYSGPWKYDKDKDIIRTRANNHRPSNPWHPRDAFFASAIYLQQLGAARDECNAAASYYAGSSWKRSSWANQQRARNYCQAVLSNARVFQRDVDYLENQG